MHQSDFKSESTDHDNGPKTEEEIKEFEELMEKISAFNNIVNRSQ